MRLSVGFFSLLFFSPAPVAAQEQARVEIFAPQGTVKKVRQVQVRFSEQIVPFGDPAEAVIPFTTDCAEKGTGRWVDGKNWVYDFDRDLPAGIRCAFTLRESLRTLSGKPISGPRRFAFSTGGPAILVSDPHQGSEHIDEEQVFILELDAEPTDESVLANVWFSVRGIREKVGVRIVSGDDRKQILDSRYWYQRKPEAVLLFIQGRQRFPSDSRVDLIWGGGVRSKGGVTTDQDQVLPFETRPAFVASLHCRRVNAEADCIPLTPISLHFSAPVRWKQARQIVLKGPNGKVWKPEEPRPGQGELADQVTFKGPFPERSDLKMEIPLELRDDAGRSLINSDRFPLAVRTDEYPPLAKFAAAFGIIELKANPALPVTLRNLEPEITGKVLNVSKGGNNSGTRPVIEQKVNGKILRIPSDNAGDILAWLRRIHARNWDDRGTSIFDASQSDKTSVFSIPKPHGAKAFEVVGIPLKEPGFYIVEIESEILGAALLGKQQPMFVPAAALVTNLSVHFKWGIENSIVWVTTLDKAQPVKSAKIQITDCEGHLRWAGATDEDGVARISELSTREKVAHCSWGRSYANGLFVSAQTGEDVAFAHSSWSDGIEPWRFQLPTEYDSTLFSAHTVFDRTLLRAGETVHMKHFLRRHVTGGFAPVPENERPQWLIVQHLGSDQKYDFPLRWDASGIVETEWNIPKEAKLGTYEVFFSRDREGHYGQRWSSGQFRVEEYRVPLMRGAIQPVGREALVRPSNIQVDLSAHYLAGGAASYLPVKFRHSFQPQRPHFEEFEGFQFANGSVKEDIHRGWREPEQRDTAEVRTIDLTLDKNGVARATVADLPAITVPSQMVAELEFRDPNGEIQTVSSRIPVWPAERLVGIKPDSWSFSKDLLKFQVAVTNLSGQPVLGAAVQVDVFQRITYSHRKRLVGGFYGYEHSSETKKIGSLCQVSTSHRGVAVCEVKPPASGNLILQATAADDSGRTITAHGEVWVAGEEAWWFEPEDHDRMDLLAERRRYEPGEKARFQVRMPFRQATALVTVEREGISDIYIKKLSGNEPVIEIPVKGNYAPNVYVSVLAIRGRVSGVQPTATVDLGRPAYKLGVDEIKVGWRAHELKVKVSADREVYRVREKARVKIGVKTADGKVPTSGELAVAAVDEGLLELMPNSSWQILEALMGRRAYAVTTATAQMHVVGKRHFGLKALPQGGGGGKQITRELFDTLLLWKGRVPLNSQGEAEVEIPLNDSLTSFRIVAVASAALDRFGSGSTSIRSTQDLMILSGVAPLVREGDRFRSEFTVRNATDREMRLQVRAAVRELKDKLNHENLVLGPGEARIVGWEITAPVGIDLLNYEIEAADERAAGDRISVRQKVVPAVPVRTFQATLAQLDQELKMAVERPAEALPGRGGISVILSPTLLTGLAGVNEYMRRYPYGCLEQRASRAVALGDADLWNRTMAELPAYLDRDGLAQYFPSMWDGSDVLTSYLIAIAHEAGWRIPAEAEQKMKEGLLGFVEGRVIRYSSLPTVDLAVRKLAAIEALSRSSSARAGLLSSISIEPNLWPTSAVIDWFNILQRVDDIPNRRQRSAEAEQILRSRLNFQGTIMGFSTERSDRLWWLMLSTDANAIRLILSLLNFRKWNEDLPRLMRGVLARQRRGHWDLTTANAWGVLAVEKFAKTFETTPVSGRTTARLSTKSEELNWQSRHEGGTLSFPWPSRQEELSVRHGGEGRPWVTIQSLAAIPLREPLSTGYKIEKTLHAVERKRSGVWSKGDIVRVRLRLESQAAMTWVVINDPIPAGATILGSGLGRDSRLATQGEQRDENWVWPTFQERSFEAHRVYYHYVPKGEWTFEYTIRLNQEGMLQLPPTRVEALYSPEMFGELPNPAFQVQE